MEKIKRRSYSTDLTDKQWEEIAPLFVSMRNRKWKKRELVNAVLYLGAVGKLKVNDRRGKKHKVQETIS